MTVTAVNRFDDSGEIGDAVRQHDERAWNLLQADVILCREIEAALRADETAVRSGIPTVAEYAARKIDARRNAAKKTG